MKTELKERTEEKLSGHTCQDCIHYEGCLMSTAWPCEEDIACTTNFELRWPF